MTRRLQRIGLSLHRSVAIGRFYHAAKAEKTIQACALRLLRSWLSPEQRAEFDTRGYFDVVGCDSGKRYRIRQGTSGNFNELDEYGRLGTGWCFVPLGGLVEGDVMLAQKIALETDEERALSVGNTSRDRFGGAYQVVVQQRGEVWAHAFIPAKSRSGQSINLQALSAGRGNCGSTPPRQSSQSALCSEIQSAPSGPDDWPRSQWRLGAMFHYGHGSGHKSERCFALRRERGAATEGLLGSTTMTSITCFKISVAKSAITKAKSSSISAAVLRPSHRRTRAVRRLQQI